MSQAKTLTIIDGHALLQRAYHALPPLITQSGVLVNGVYGFFSVFLKMVNEIKPDYLVCCFDRAESTFRHKKYKDYKVGSISADAICVYQSRLTPAGPIYTLLGTYKLI